MLSGDLGDEVGVMVKGASGNIKQHQSIIITAGHVM